ncbi:MAG: hypothetical protein LC745_04900, partial [Planctomycetia bacterium]|nr:hypothetical protein [Planctomycetia bacterium]
MRRERVVMFWSACGLACGVLGATVWAQPPVPAPPPEGPVPGVVYRSEGGPIHRAARHVGRVLQDNFIGYPQEFIEPPPGYAVSEAFGAMKGKANIHRFTLYRTDFLNGSDKLSPTGAGRFNLMATRLGGWFGPVVIEWSPDQPGLAEARRLSVLTILHNAKLPMTPDRVVIGPSPYPGMLGTDAANNYGEMISRDQRAPTSYSVTPTAGA